MGFPSTEELVGWIGLEEADSVRALHARAYAVKEEIVGRRVSMRGLDENAGLCRGCLQRRIESIGETVLWGVHGDSAHFFARQHA